MTQFENLKADTQENNRTIQLALREIDSQDLAAALVDLPEEIRQIFLRNMSRRACEMLLGEIKEKQGSDPEESKAAQKLLLSLLEKHKAALQTDHEVKGDGNKNDEESF